MVFGILVVYTESYFLSSLREFEKVLKLISSDYKVVVVLNNSDLREKINVFMEDGTDYILGSNSFYEFSGWDEGLTFIKENYFDSYKDSGYVFCNDTFCHHRTYTFIHSLALSFSSRFALSSSKPTIAGEVNSIGKSFEFNNIKLDSWVSSYFFSVNNLAMKLLDFEVLPTNEVVNKYLVGGAVEEDFFSEAMDSTLKRHLLHWLFHGGWYRSEPLNSNNMKFFYYKARSIIAEYNLSSKAYKNNLVFIDTYYLIKLINKIFRGKR